MYLYRSTRQKEVYLFNTSIVARVEPQHLYRSTREKRYTFMPLS